MRASHFHALAMSATPPKGHRFANTDPHVVIGNFPWYDMLWRSLRGDFKPKSPPQGGYQAFVQAWTQLVDHGRLAQRQTAPVVTWLGHVSTLLQVGGLNVLRSEEHTSEPVTATSRMPSSA